jgi:hypothetical protein
MNAIANLALDKLKYYPVVCVVIFSIQTIVDIYQNLGNTIVIEVHTTCNVLFHSVGTFSAIIFWFSNKDVQTLWYPLLFSYRIDDQVNRQTEFREYNTSDIQNSSSSISKSDVLHKLDKALANASTLAKIDEDWEGKSKVTGVENPINQTFQDRLL